MSNRALVIVVIAWAMVAWLAMTPLGAMVGFFEGIAVAFFVAPLVFLLHVPQEALTPLVWAGLAAWGLWALTMAGVGVYNWRKGDATGARGAWAVALSLAMIPVVLKLCADALVANWH